MNGLPTTRANWHVMLCALAVISLTAITHLAIFRADTGHRYPDSFTYLAPAAQMAAGNGFVDAPGVPDTIRTPGYPAFLAICRLVNLDDRGIVLLQHCASILFSLGLFSGALALTGSNLAATIAGIIYALDPTTIRYGNLLLTESLFTILLFLILFLAARMRGGKIDQRVAVIGVLTGLLSIVRPAALFYPFLLLPVFLLRTDRGRRRIALVFAISAGLVPVGWAFRNSVQTGIFTFCSISGTNLLMHRAAGALAMEDGGNFDLSLTRHQNELLAQAQGRLQRRYGVPASTLPHAVQSRQYAVDARPVIMHHLPAYARLTIRGIRKNLLTDDAETITSLNDTSLDDEDIAAAVRLYTAVLPLLALLGVLILVRTDASLAWLLGATVVYFVFIAAGAESESRFRAPVVPEMAMLAGVSAGQVLRLLRFRGTRSLSAAPPSEREASEGRRGD